MKLKERLRELETSESLRVPPGVHQGGLGLRCGRALRAREDAILSGGESVLFVSTKGDLLIDGLILRRGISMAGGGLHLDRVGSLHVKRTSFVENQAPRTGGGGLYVGQGEVLLEDCLLAGNRAKRGGGVLAQGASKLLIRNTLFWANEAKRGSVVAAEGQSEVVLDECTIFANPDAEGALFDLRGQARVCLRRSLVIFGGGNLCAPNAQLVVEDSTLWSGSGSPPLFREGSPFLGVVDVNRGARWVETRAGLGGRLCALMGDEA